MSPGSIRVRRGRMMVVVSVSALGAVVAPIVMRPRQHYAGDMPIAVGGFLDAVARCGQADVLDAGSDSMNVSLSPADLERCQRAARQVMQTRAVEARYAPSPIVTAVMPQRWHGHRAGAHLAA